MKNVSNIKVVMLSIIVILIAMLFFNSSDKTKRVRIAHMEGHINRCEETLDSLENVISFMDTIGETDEYCDMEECYVNFRNTKDKKTKTIYYKQYMKHYHRIMCMAVEQIKKKAVYEYEESLPIHTCGGE